MFIYPKNLKKIAQFKINRILKTIIIILIILIVTPGILFIKNNKKKIIIIKFYNFKNKRKKYQNKYITKLE